MKKILSTCFCVLAFCLPSFAGRVAQVTGWVITLQNVGGTPWYGTASITMYWSDNTGGFPSLGFSVTVPSSTPIPPGQTYSQPVGAFTTPIYDNEVIFAMYYATGWPDPTHNTEVDGATYSDTSLGASYAGHIYTPNFPVQNQFYPGCWTNICLTYKNNNDFPVYVMPLINPNGGCSPAAGQSLYSPANSQGSSPNLTRVEAGESHQFIVEVACTNASKLELDALTGGDGEGGSTFNTVPGGCQWVGADTTQNGAGTNILNYLTNSLAPVNGINGPSWFGNTNVPVVAGQTPPPTFYNPTNGQGIIYNAALNAASNTYEMQGLSALYDADTKGFIGVQQWESNIVHAVNGLVVTSSNATYGNGVSNVWVMNFPTNQSISINGTNFSA